MYRNNACVILVNSTFKSDKNQTCLYKKVQEKRMAKYSSGASKLIMAVGNFYFQFLHMCSSALHLIVNLINSFKRHTSFLQQTA